VGFLVALARRGLAIPATAVGLLLLARGAAEGLRASPFDPQAPLQGMLFVASQPRVVLLVLGLWLAGRLLGLVLHLAWLAVLSAPLWGATVLAVVAAALVFRYV